MVKQGKELAKGIVRDSMFQFGEMIMLSNYMVAQAHDFDKAFSRLSYMSEQQFDHQAQGTWLISIRDSSGIMVPLCSMVSTYGDCLVAALCLEPVAQFVRDTSIDVDDHVEITRIAHAVAVPVEEHGVMMLDEWVKSKRTYTGTWLSDSEGRPFEGVDLDSEFISAWEYGPESNAVAVLEDSATDESIVFWGDLSFADHNDEEVLLMAYQVYLNTLNLVSDESLAVLFRHDSSKRWLSR